LELDKDNNEYIVEAASSKFLTGKLNNEDQVVDSTSDQFFAAEFSRVDISPENKHEHCSFGHEHVRRSCRHWGYSLCASLSGTLP
jgi:hypothetical protein